MRTAAPARASSPVATDLSAAADANAVYFAGHERFSMNPNDCDALGLNGYNAAGMERLDPANGNLYKSADGTVGYYSRDRGPGADDEFLTGTGLWIVRDNLDSGRVETLSGICFLPYSQTFSERGRVSAHGQETRPRLVMAGRRAWSRCRFAVRRPGSPVASPRSHGMPCRGFVLGAACTRLAVADNLNMPSGADISGEVKRRFLSGLKVGVSTPRSL